MARVIGTPGESAAARGLLFLVVALSLIFVGIFLPSLYALIFAARRQGLIGVLLTLVAVALAYWFRRGDLAEVWDGVREGRNFIQGAKGEVLVHRALAGLSDEFIVFHDFHPFDSATGKPSKWNVDHIVVGPTGVFVIDAKYYSNPRVARADKSSFSRKNVRQTQRNAMELKDKLVKWSAGDLAKLFVVPVVVYAQPDASVERLNEGVVRTIPLRLLMREVTSHTESSIDQERAGRVARVLFSQVGSDLRYSFKSEFDAYGELSKAARSAAHDARLAQRAAITEMPIPPVAQDPPGVCPHCGGALVRKIAKAGSRAGKPFLGCTNYRRTGCRYGWNLEG